MYTYVLRIWLPDRPGALGQVASRIGAVRGDVVGIDILERGGGSAIDELTITLPDDDLVDLLLDEVRQVDGVAVEDIRVIEGERPDVVVGALTVAVDIAAAGDDRQAVAVGRLRDLFEADWTAIWQAGAHTLVAQAGSVPDGEWLGAFLEGSSHLDATDEGAPSDLLWARIEGDRRRAVAVGRRSRPFHGRERQQIAVLARLLA
jgi:hypothetical protein